MQGSIYLICDINKTNFFRYIPLINYLENKYNSKVNIITIQHKNDENIKLLVDNINKIIIFKSIFLLISFVIKNRNKLLIFIYNHRELSNIEIKIYISILLSRNKNIIFYPRSLYFLQNKIGQSNIKKNFKRNLINTLIRKTKINVNIYLAYAFFIMVNLLKKKLSKNKQMQQKSKKILFIRVDRFGDMVLSFPSILALRNAFTNYKLQVLCSPANVSFVKTQNNLLPKPLDTITVWEDLWDMHGGVIPGVACFIKILKMAIKMNKDEFDIIIQPIPPATWTLFALLLKGNILVATVDENLKLGQLLKKYITYPCVIKKGEYVHCFKQVSNCLLPLGIKEVKKTKLLFDCNIVNPFIRSTVDNKSIIINLSAGDRARELGKSQLVRLLKLLIHHFIEYKIVLIGINKDQKLANFLKQMSDAKIINLVGETSINDLIYIFNTAPVLITPDTGTMHLASLTNIYIVAYFGAGNVRHFAPITDRFSIIRHELGCSGCGDICFTDRLPKPCIEEITPEEIFEEVKKVLK